MRLFTRGAVLTLGALAFGLAVLAGPAPGWAADRGTKEQARDLVTKAYDALMADRGSALQEISNTSGPYVDRDLYVIVFDESNVIQAHGANNKLIGKNLTKAKDPDGVQFVLEFRKTIAANPDGGWVNFKFTHPSTKKIENKGMWIRDLNGWMVMAGAYPGS